MGTIGVVDKVVEQRHHACAVTNEKRMHGLHTAAS